MSTNVDHNYLIFSGAGKLVYAYREGDNHHLSGIIHALIAKSELMNNKLQYFKTTNRLIVLYNSLNLNYISITSHQSIDNNRLELKLLEQQIIMSLSKSQLERIFKDQPNYDLSQMIIGTEPVLENLIRNFKSNNFRFEGNLKQPCLDRQLILHELGKQPKSILFTMIFYKHKLVHKSKNLHPMDVNLVSNLIYSSNSFQAIQSWMPICLPNHDPSKFLNLYSSFITLDMSVVFLSLDRESFYELSKFHERLKLKFENLQFPNDIKPPAGMIRFLVKIDNYLIESELVEPYTNSIDLNRLNLKFQNMDNNLKMQVMTSDDEIIVFKKVKGMHLYCAFGPMFDIHLIPNLISELLVILEKQLYLYTW